MNSNFILSFLVVTGLSGTAEAAVPRVLVAPIEAQAGLADLAYPVRHQLCAHLDAYEGAKLVAVNADHVVRATLRTDGEEIELEVRLTRTPGGEELHRFLVEDDNRDAKKIAAGAAAGLSAYWLDHPSAPAAKRPIAEPKPEPARVASVPVVRSSIATVTTTRPAPEVEVETSNALAGWLFWGGMATAAAGAGLGAVGHLGYDVALTDGTKRPAGDNQALLDGGRSFAVAGDAALISGGVIAAVGVALWIAGVGESAVATGEVTP